jgi:alpha-ketoglutarate-dependent taurine dioxygenase
MNDDFIYANPLTVSADAVLQRFLQDGYAVLRCEDSDLSGFRAFSERFGQCFVSGQGGGNHGRTPIGADGTIFSATGAEHLYAIPLHGERYFTANPPGVLFFYCANPADHGGETLVCDGVRLYQSFPAHLQELFAGQAITYVRQHEPKVWRDIYRTDSLSEVREICRQNGIGVETYPDGSISTRYTCSALKNTHRGTAFINNLLPFAWREVQEGRRYGSYVCFEDGNPIPKEAVLQIAELGKFHGKAIRWRSGDIAMIDNRFMLHGREHIDDTRRTIYLRMADKLRQLPLD